MDCDDGSGSDEIRIRIQIQSRSDQIRSDQLPDGQEVIFLESNKGLRIVVVVKSRG